jgi:4-hydroxybenzoate polyprenyltransferase
MLKNLKTTLEMIKFEHTLFALPFALLGAVLAARGWPGWEPVFWIRGGDGRRAFGGDGLQPAGRPGHLTRPIRGRGCGRFRPGCWEHATWCFFTIVAAVVFMAAAAMLNPLALKLSPLALGSVLLYSYTKRFTALLARGAGMGAGDCADRGLDCGARSDRCTDPGSAEPGGAALDGRV